MTAIVTSDDGNSIFLALEDTSGFPVFVYSTYADPTTFVQAYAPGAGSAGNVVAVPGDGDKVLFFGNFGTDVTVIEYTISTDATNDISPASLGAKVVNTLEIDPADPLIMYATVDTDQDLIQTLDGGTTWTTLDNALGFDATALEVLFSGAYELDRAFMAGLVGAGDVDLLYTPNEGASNQNMEDAVLGAVANICGLEVG